MEKRLDPPEATHFAINSTVKVLIQTIRDGESLGNRTEAGKWAEQVLSKLGLDGSYFLNYRYHDQEYDITIIADGDFDSDKSFRKSDYHEYNIFDAEDEIISEVSTRLMILDIYDEDFQIDIIDYETVEA